MKSMPLAYFKVTAQGQISVPAGVRRKLGIAPGSVLEWREEGGKVVVSRSARFTSEDIHRAVFRGPAKLHALDELDQGIRRHVRKRHARP